MPARQSVHVFEMADPTSRSRVAARTADKTMAQAITREVESLYTNGPAGGGGIRSHIQAIVSIGSILIPETDTDITVSYWEVK